MTRRFITCGFALALGCLLGCGPTAPTTSTATPPTYVALSGRVVEAVFFPVKDARVEIIGGPMNGSVAMTDSGGYFLFNEVTGALQVRASKDGYVPATKDVTHTRSVDLELTYAAPPVTGVYRLTFTASPSCQLPDEARRRVYTTTINQGIGGVALAGAQFYTDGYCGVMNSFDALVHGNTVILSVDGAGDCGIAEQLANTRYLELWGRAEVTLTDPIASAAYDGTVSVVTSPGHDSHPIATCTASDHQLLFERNVAPLRK